MTCFAIYSHLYIILTDTCLSKDSINWKQVLNGLLPLVHFVGFMLPIYFIMLAYYLSSTVGYQQSHWQFTHLLEHSRSSSPYLHSTTSVWLRMLTIIWIEKHPKWLRLLIKSSHTRHWRFDLHYEMVQPIGRHPTLDRSSTPLLSYMCLHFTALVMGPFFWTTTKPNYPISRLTTKLTQTDG